MAKNIFLNLPVKDIEKTNAFFTHLGFGFNPQFSSEQATCMVVTDNIFVMLLHESFFGGFTKKPIADAHGSTEMLIGLDAENRDAVDTMIAKAIEAGGTHTVAVQDHGWMYSHGFADLDGHQWEVFWMDPAGPPAA